MRYLRLLIVMVTIVGAYFLGFSGGVVESNERVDDDWHLVQHRDEGPVCFNTLEDGASRILVTPTTQSIVPSFVDVKYRSAAFVVNQVDFEINVRSNFEIGFRLAPHLPDEIADYPKVYESVGHIAPGEYDVYHGAIYLGTIQLPAPAVRSDEYGQCLQPPAVQPPSPNASER